MFIVTLATGSVMVAAIAMSPMYARRVRFQRSPFAGILLVCGSIGLGLAARGSADTTPPRDDLFLCLFAMLLLGALLIVADPGDDGFGDDSGGDGPDEDPPWWPEFEAGFRSYARHSRRPLVTR